MAILLHFFVEARDKKAAKNIAGEMRAMADKIQKGCRFKAPSLEPYWKISGWYDASFLIVVPQHKDELTVERALASGIATGWKWLPGKEAAVCTDDKGRGKFKVPHVRWAELALR